jgi:uncharacterized protein YndB with AHSA1/START domain
VIRDGRTEHEAVYPHPPNRVWQALVDPSELAAWLMPNNFAAQVGHRFTFDARPALGTIAAEVLVPGAVRAPQPGRVVSASRRVR